MSDSKDQAKQLTADKVITGLINHVDRYDIWYGGGSKYRRDEMNYDKNNDDGEWVKWDDVITLIQLLGHDS